MLSIATLQSATQASSYYKKEDYYTSEIQGNNSSWFGIGAKKLGLEGLVEHDEFKKLLAGELPDGTNMFKGYNKEGEQTHRPGYDLTFSAAKSASILAFKDPRIVVAHNEAVKATLQYIEGEACARVKIEGIVKPISTKNLIVATFLHNVSRKLDPNLHTHCVILNMTEIEGKWRSIYGDNYYNLKKSLGLQYRLEFAQKLMKLGYELEQTSNDGLFEIKGVPIVVLKQLSQRRQEIEHILKSKGLDPQQKVTMVLNKGTSYEKTITTVASSMANLVTRDRKKSANLEQLKERWDKEIEATGFTVKELEDIVQQAKDKGEIKVKEVLQEINKAIPVALEHMANKKAVFSRYDLTYSIKALCITAIPNSVIIDKAITKQIENKLLIPVGEDKFTTAKAINIEQNNITIMQKQKGTCKAFFPIGAEMVARVLTYGSNKKEALHKLLSSRDRFIAIDCQHEIEQQQLIKVFNRSSPLVKNYVVGPNLELAKEFAVNSGLSRAFSLNGFLYYTDKLIKEQRQNEGSILKFSHVWLIQRSHSLANKDVAKLQENAVKLNARIIYLGDHMRGGAASAGSPFRYLLDNDIQQINLAGDKLDHLTLLREQKCGEAIEQMEKAGNLQAISSRKERMEQAIQFIANNNGILITQNNIDKQTANLAIREFKQQHGQLVGKAIKTQILIPVLLSNLQKGMLASYQVGDLVRFNREIQNSVYEQGKYFTIDNIDPNNNLLTLLDHNDNCFKFEINNKIASKLAIYRPQIRELQVGDTIIWQDNTPKKLQEFANFAKTAGKIMAINENKQVTVKVVAGSTITLDLNKLQHQHIEYAYARNLNSCAKQDFANGVLLLNSNSYPNLTLSEVYTGLSAIKGEKKIICDNIELFKQNLIIHSGLKEHAHLQKEVITKEKIKEQYFSRAMGKIDGTLSRHHEMLARIVPEVKLINEQLTQIGQTPEYLQAIQAVDFAISKLSEREAVFFGKDLLTTAKQYDVTIDAKFIEFAVNQAITEGWVINKGEKRLVTKEVYAMECACLKIQKHGEGAVKSIITGPHSALEQVKKHERFTDSQKQAILLAVTSSDRVNLIQGVAGAGKTTMLKEIKRLSIEAGFELLGVANTASARNNLYEKTAEDFYEPDDPRTFVAAGIPSKTLASFLNQTEKMLETFPEFAKLTYSKNTVFVLDEASLVSVRDMFAFLNIVEQLDGRAVIVGDNRQLPSIEASRPFQLLLGQSNSKVVMNINTRLQTKEALRLMQDVYAARIDDAFDKLVNNLVEIPNREERLQAMARYYLNATKEDREQIMPMLPLNQDRVDFNKLVRSGLKEEGTLTGDAITSNVLVAKDLTYPETNYALSFEVGNWVKFNHAVSRLGINKGDLLLVTDRKDNNILLVDLHDNKVHWDPLRFAAYYKGAIEVYNKETRELMAGDLIRWKQNDEDRGIINSETAKVLKIQQHQAKIKLNNGNTITIDLTKHENQHWDHAYGATVHVVQGLDRRNPIGQGLGAAPYERDISKIQKNDMIVIPGDQKSNTVSKVGKVTNIINKDNEIEVLAVDRYKNEHKLIQKTLEVYPDFNKVKAPRISSIESFLVMATRGDKLVMFVDNIEGYKAALKDNQNIKQTALEIMMPNLGAEIKDKVATMTQEVYGLADQDGLKQLKNINDKTIAITATASDLNFNEHRKQRNNYDLEAIKKALESDVLGYVSKWKGEPDKKTGREARWGKKGSFSVVLSGPKIGTWADFEFGAAGKDLVSLYMHIFNLEQGNFPKVLEELAQETGIGPSEAPKNYNNKEMAKVKNNIEKEQKLVEERAGYINKVNKLYSSCKPITGTLGEKYLRKVRGIGGELPGDFKFKARCWHSELKTYRAALIIPGYGKDGSLQTINRIYLDKEGRKINETFIDDSGKEQTATVKRTYGPTAGTTVKINASTQSEVTLVTEGVENALSIKQVQPEQNIISSLGVWQLQNLTLEQNTKTIILCADNDGLATNTKKPMLEAIQKWIEQGYEVKLAMPFSTKLENKIDFNDLLKQQGDSAISKVLSSAIKVSDLSSFKNQDSSLSQDFLKAQKIEQDKSEKVIGIASSGQDKFKGEEKEL